MTGISTGQHVYLISLCVTIQANRVSSLLCSTRRCCLCASVSTSLGSSSHSQSSDMSLRHDRLSRSKQSYNSSRQSSYRCRAATSSGDSNSDLFISVPPISHTLRNVPTYLVTRPWHSWQARELQSLSYQTLHHNPCSKL